MSLKPAFGANTMSRFLLIRTVSGAGLAHAVLVNLDDAYLGDAVLGRSAARRLPVDKGQAREHAG